MSASRRASKRDEARDWRSPGQRRGDTPHSLARVASQNNGRHPGSALPARQPNKKGAHAVVPNRGSPELFVREPGDTAGTRQTAGMPPISAPSGTRPPVTVVVSWGPRFATPGRPSEPGLLGQDARSPRTSDDRWLETTLLGERRPRGRLVNLCLGTATQGPGSVITACLAFLIGGRQTRSAEVFPPEPALSSLETRDSAPQVATPFSLATVPTGKLSPKGATPPRR
jgi:hypothetical protein